MNKIFTFEIDDIFTWGYKDVEKGNYIRAAASKSVEKGNQLPKYETLVGRPLGFKIKVDIGRNDVNKKQIWNKDLDNVPKLIIDAFNKKVDNNIGINHNYGLYDDDNIRIIKHIELVCNYDKDITKTVVEMYDLSERKYCCPIGTGCNEPCTDDYRMSVHIKGAHIKKEGMEYKDVEGCIKKSNLPDDFIDSLLNRLNVNEPEISVDDEYLNTSGQEVQNANDDKSYVSNYIDSSTPFCREERQYAFLFALRMPTDEKLNELLGFKDCEILSVLYEAALMRDLWVLDKNKFNNKLKEYINENHNGCLNVNEEIKHANKWANSHPYARWMMNCKPDIGVFVRDKENKIYLHFIECKYLSGEDTYTENGFEKTQTETQQMILEFLCNNKYMGILYGKEQPVLAGKARLVKFNNNPTIPNDAGNINIQNMLLKNIHEHCFMFRK